MTNDVPATDSPAPLLTFPDMVRAVPSPRGWLLKAWNQSEPDAQEPHHIAPLPIAGKLSLETWLAAAGAGAGQYRVELDPVAAAPSARRHRLDRLQQRGPVTGIVAVTPAHVKEAGDLAERAEPARRHDAAAPPRARVSEDSVRVKSKLEEAAVQKAENERLAAELEHRRLLAEMRKLDDEAKKGGPAPASPFAGFGAIIAPFAPVVVDLVRTFIDNQRAQAEALREALTREPAMPAYAIPPAAQNGGLTLGNLLELVPQIKELAKLVGGIGGGDGDDRPSETMEMLGLVRDVLGQVGSSPAAPEPVASPAANGVAKRRRVTPQEAMNIRVLKFFFAIMQEQALTADPATTADKLFAQIGTLPEDFRTLIATSQNVETLLAGLPRWLPANMKTTVPNAIRQDQAKREWLATFLDTVHELADSSGVAAGEDGDDLPAGEDDAGAE